MMKVDVRIADAAIENMAQEIATLGHGWARSPLRPRIDPATCQGWDELIEQWIASDLPLIVRKASLGRGAEFRDASGRRYTAADNTPASWVFQHAWAKLVPSLQDIENWFADRQIPLAFGFKKSEIAASVYARGGLSRPLRPNAEGWKVCHIDQVSVLADRSTGERQSEHLHQHFRRFLRPSNMFLIPKKMGGLGEIDIFISAIKDFEHQSGRGSP